MAKYEIINGVGIIPEDETIVKAEAFSGCEDLTSIVIPSSITEIRFKAFSCCSNLESITIPKSVTSISSDSFAGCANLKSIVVEEGNPVYDSRDKCNAIIRGNTLVRGCCNTIIPDGIKVIGAYAFSTCTDLTSIVVPDGIEEIGTSAFAGCTNLTDIAIPEGVKKIGNESFYGCSSLKAILIPKTVVEIGKRFTFAHCDSLSSIIVENGNIVYDSRNDCNAIIENGNTLIVGCCNSVIPEGVETVEENAFCGCISLTKINLPESLKKIGGNAFSGCIMLKEIVIPENVEVIEDMAFEKSGLTSITVPAKVKDLNRVFFQCETLKSVVICGKLEDYRTTNVFPFKYCSSLESITFLDCVRYLKDESCTGCKSLKHIFVPAKKGDYYKKRFVEELHPLIAEMEPVKKSKKNTVLQ